MAKPIVMNEVVLNAVYEQWKSTVLGKKFVNLKDKISNNITVNPAQKVEVEFSTKSYLKIQQLVHSFSGEVGWHGTARKVTKGKYVIDDIIVYPQDVTSVTVVAGQVEYQNFLNQLDDDTFNNLRFHGHSHVNMACSPSGTDRSLYDGILAQLEEDMFYIFMIFNKQGDIFVEVHDMADNLIYEKDDVIIKSEFFDSDKDFLAEAKKIVNTTNKKANTSSTTKSTSTVSSAYKGSSGATWKTSAVSTPVKKEVKKEVSIKEYDEDIDDDQALTQAYELGYQHAMEDMGVDYRYRDDDYYLDDYYDDDWYNARRKGYEF